MSKRNKFELAEHLINQFSKKFFDEIGVLPIVNYSLWGHDMHNFVSLSDIEDIVNDTFKAYYPEAYPSLGIKTKSRKSLTTLHRQIFYKIARETGYCFNVIGKHLGYDHATVLYSNRHITNLLETKDIQVCKTYYRVQNEIKNKYGVKRDVQPDNNTGTNT